MHRLAILLDRIGFTWIAPLARLAAGDNPGYQLRSVLNLAGPPLLAVAIAVLAWHLTATTVRIGTLALPTPAQVLERGVEQVREWRADQMARGEYEKQVLATVAEQGLSEAEVRQLMPYQGRKLFVSQVILSLETVFVGVAIALVIAIPVGLVCGLSTIAYRMLNPLIQLFKPVSPLAWFPLVYLVINRAIPNNEGPLSKSFLVAALVVGLCALWPALVNTAMGVSAIEKDHLNVARVLNLSWWRKLWSIVLPASLPAIFTGARISLGVGWMVLIAAEMMAVSPGIGGFVWDWYQSSNDIAMAYLVLSVVVIGSIGFALDKLMITAQVLVSRGRTVEIR
jgi:nitrate/nitrite transport system permease protein